MTLFGMSLAKRTACVLRVSDVKTRGRQSIAFKMLTLSLFVIELNSNVIEMNGYPFGRIVMVRHHDA